MHLLHDLSQSIYASAVPSRRSNYLFIYLYLSLVLWKCATLYHLASIVLPVVVLWFFMRCSGGCVLFVVVVDRAFEPVGDRSRFDHPVVGSFHGGRNAEPSTFPSF